MLRVKLKDRYKNGVSESHLSMHNDIYRKFRTILDYLLSMKNPAIERREFDRWYVSSPIIEAEIQQAFTSSKSSSRLFIGKTGMGKSTIIRYVLSSLCKKQHDEPSIIDDTHLVIPFFFTTDALPSVPLCERDIRKKLSLAITELIRTKNITYDDSELVKFIQDDPSGPIGFLSESEKKASPEKILGALESIGQNFLEMSKLMFLLKRTNIENMIIVVDDIEALRFECQKEIVIRTLRLFDYLVSKQYRVNLLLSCRDSTIKMFTNIEDRWFTAASFPHPIKMNKAVDLCRLFKARFNSAAERLKLEAWVLLTVLPSEVEDPIKSKDKTKPEGKLSFDSDSNLLFFEGAMTEAERTTLKGLSSNSKYLIAIDKLYKESNKANINRESWETAYAVLNNIATILCSRYGDIITYLYNFNIREAIREFQTILTNRRWFQMNMNPQAHFTLSEYNFALNEAAIYRAMGLREGVTYPSEDTPIANLLWNQEDERSDLLLSYVIRWFLAKEDESRQDRFWSWNDVKASFQSLFNIDPEIINKMLEGVFEYMLKTSRLVHSEIHNPTTGVRSLQLTERTRILWKLLDLNSLCLEFYRDDTYHVEGTRRLIRANEMKGEDLFSENLVICHEVLKKEKSIIEWIDSKELIPEYKNSFGTELLSDKLLRGVEKSAENYYKGEIPEKISNDMKKYKGFVEEINKFFKS